MKTTTKSAAKPRASRKEAKPSTTPAKSTRKLETLSLRLPRNHLLTYQVCAEHFGTTPEAIMQCDALGELNFMKDSPFRALHYMNEALRETDDMETVTLSFLPSALALLETLAALVRQPLEEFVARLACSSADTLLDHVKDAMDKGGIDTDPHLAEWAESWMRFEFETRRGRMPVDEHGDDAWLKLEVEMLRPVSFAKEGGAQ